MIQDNTVTIRLPPSQMALLRFTAFHRDVTVERLVVEQLDLDGLEGIYAALVQDTGQGKMARADIRKCQRCKHLRLLGGGATLCYECEHEFADQCPDVLHDVLAVLEQGDDSSDDGFNCPNCNMRLVQRPVAVSTRQQEVQQREHPDLSPSADTTGSPGAGPINGGNGSFASSRAYDIQFCDEQTFDVIACFAKASFALVGEDASQRIIHGLDEGKWLLRGVLQSDIAAFVDALAGFIDFCGTKWYSPNPDDIQIAHEVTTYGPVALKTIENQVRRADAQHQTIS